MTSQTPASDDGRTVVCPDCGRHFVPGAAASPTPAADASRTIFDIAKLKAEEPIEPDRLMERMERASVWPQVGVSLAVHLVVIAITSIGFLQLASRYGTLDPRSIAAARAREAEAAEETADADAADADAPAAGEAPAAGGDAGDAASATPEAGEAPAGEDESASDGDGKSAIEQTLEETSSERPTESDLGLDRVLDLE
ncbi:MAG: hypothetical protein ACOCX4_00270 [Planctomycetota bacterium]